MALQDGTQLQNIGQALGGFGAGIQGNLPQYQAAQQDIATGKQEMEEARTQAMYEDALGALNFAEAGDWDGAVQLGMNRLQALQQLNANPEDTQRIMKVLLAAKNGNEEAKDLAKAELESIVETGYVSGGLERPEREALTNTGKIRQDYENGLFGEPGSPEALKTLEDLLTLETEGGGDRRLSQTPIMVINNKTGELGMAQTSNIPGQGLEISTVDGREVNTDDWDLVGPTGMVDLNEQVAAARRRINVADIGAEGEAKTNAEINNLVRTREFKALSEAEIARAVQNVRNELEPILQQELADIQSKSTVQEQEDLYNQKRDQTIAATQSSSWTGVNQKEDEVALMKYQIARAREYSGAWTNGLTGAALGTIAGTNAFALRGIMDNMKAVAGFDKLQQMRAGAPTGASGLGQISERELAFLQGVWANLTASNDTEEFKINLDLFENAVQSSWNRALRSYEDTYGFSYFDSPQSSFAPDDDVNQFINRER